MRKINLTTSTIPIKSRNTICAGNYCSAILLKFYTALQGGYSVPGKKLGGVAKYNGRGTKNFLGIIKKESSFIKINNSCTEDVYTDSIANEACDLEIGDTYDSCIDKYEESISTKGINI